jgi:site-specific recombinase XerD
MASSRKRTNRFEISYYFAGKRHYETYPVTKLPPGRSAERWIQERCREIESQLFLHKQGKIIFQPNKHTTRLVEGPSLKDLARHFHHNCRRRGLSDRTIDSYQNALTLFAGVVGWDIPIKTITTLHLEHYKDQSRLAGTSREAINKYLSFLRPAFTFAFQSGWITTIPEIKKFENTRYHETYYWTDDEIERLAANMRGYPRLALEIARWTGIRRTELTERLFRKDISLDDGIIVITNHKKKQKTREPMPMHQRLIHYLQHDPLFRRLNPDDRVIPLTVKGMQSAMYTAKKKAGITKPGGWHNFRHYWGWKFAENPETDIYFTQIFLRHNNIKTTQRYSHLRTRTIREKLNKFK